MAFSLEPVEEGDYEALLALNTASVPHVNLIDRQELDLLVQMAHLPIKVVRGNELAGFVLALGPGCAYSSLNYQWFNNQFDRFLYIDRIEVAPAFRRQGVATRLYGHLAEIGTGAQLERLCCEVNISPPNPGSLALHHQLGFVEAGKQETEGGAKVVSLLVRELAQ